VILALGDKPVENTNALRNRVAQSQPGTAADLTIRRDGSERHLSVKLDELTTEADRSAKSDGSGSADKGLLGVSVQPLTPQLAERLGANANQGLVSAEVNPDGRAADAGLQEGDVIVSVNRQSVSSVEELRSALGKTPDRPALLLIDRKGQNLFVPVRPAKD
jgi:serine protease Do